MLRLILLVDAYKGEGGGSLQHDLVVTLRGRWICSMEEGRTRSKMIKERKELPGGRSVERTKAMRWYLYTVRESEGGGGW